MTLSHFLSANLLLAYGAYFVGTASPGPSNLAIMSMAMSSGRKAAVVFALGVISGSCFWALLATLGISATLATYSRLLLVIKMGGGLYLLWLAVKSARAAWRASVPQALAPARAPESLPRLYLRGLLMHLTNPKAILVWVSIVSLAIPPGGGAAQAGTVVAGCVLIGMLVFCGYALLFSTAGARRVYLATRRWLEGSLAIVFGVAGIALLNSRS